MKDMEKETIIPKFKESSVFYILASTAIVVTGLIYFDGIFKPLVVAFLVWFIVDQLKESIGKITIKGKSLPPMVCSILAFIIIFLLIVTGGELLMNNLEGIAASMPVYIENLNESFADVSTFVNDPLYADYIEKGIGSLNLAGMASSVLNSLSGILANAAIMIVYVVFFIIEDTTQKLKLEKLYPAKGKKYIQFLNTTKNISAAVRSYIWSKTLISLITAGVSYVILLIMGIEYAFLWSSLIFILNFIPYVGPLISSLLPAIFAVLTTGELIQFLYVFVAMEVVQIVLGNFIEPVIMGKGTNLGPISVVVALAFWGMIWGMVGMVLAIPVTAVFVIILSQIPSARYVAILVSEKGNIPAIEE
jgi:predicted PurR-regulated permease PerM